MLIESIFVESEVLQSDLGVFFLIIIGLQSHNWEIGVEVLLF